MDLNISSPAPRPKPKQQRSREKYGRVLDAAETLLAEGGYEAITTTGVAKAAGLPPSAFYRWFADRDDLFGALLLRHHARLDAEIASAVRHLDRPEWVEVAETAFTTVADYHRRNPSHHILGVRGRMGVASSRAVHDHTARLARALLDQMRAEGVAPSDITLADVKLMIEIAGRVVEVAFRGQAEGDDELLERGLAMLLAVVAEFLETPAALRVSSP